VLEARGLTKHYGGVHAVTGVDLVIKEGEFRAIIGPNGAGKSTFFKMLSGEITPTSGDVFLRGKRVTGCGATAMSQHGVCKSYQINQVFSGLTVWQNLLIPVLARIRGSFRFDVIGDAERLDDANMLVREALAMVGLNDRAQTRVDVLAYGEKRRLEVGLALATSPSILLLDEPLAGMSPEERVDIKRLLRKVHVGRTVVIIEHDMDAVFELADRVSVLSQGKLLVEGSPAEIRGSQSVQSAYLGGMDENEFA
jgi:branched-chain amino acid transport system permease protein